MKRKLVSESNRLYREAARWIEPMPRAVRRVHEVQALIEIMQSLSLERMEENQARVRIAEALFAAQWGVRVERTRVVHA